MSGRSASDNNGTEVSEGGRLLVRVELLTDDVIIVSARLGAKAFRGALLSSQFEWIKPIVSENVFNWDYSLKHNFAHTNFSTADSIVLPSKLLSSSAYICDNCKKKMFINYKTENKFSKSELSNNICKSDILLLKQTLSYSELPIQKSNVPTSIESRPCKRPSLDIIPRKLKRKKISKVVDNKETNKEENKDVCSKLRPPKIEKLEEKPLKEIGKHKLSKQNNEIKSKSFIKSESITSNQSTICHGNYRVMPQTLERLNNISTVESNQEIEEFFNRECPKPKKKWMKMNEKEDNQNSYESLNKSESIDSNVTYPLTELCEANPFLEITDQCFPFQYIKESFENPLEDVSFNPFEECVDNLLSNNIIDEVCPKSITEAVPESVDSVEEFTIKSLNDFSLEHPECTEKDFFSEPVNKDSNNEINMDCCDLKSEIQNLPLQSIIEDYPLESVIKTSIESISKYFTYESISKDFPIEFITSDLNKKSISNDHSSSFNPLIDSSYNEDFIDTLDDNFDVEIKSPEISSTSINHSKFTHFNRSYKIKQSLHDKVILTVERGSINDNIKKITEIPDVYSFTDEDEVLASADLPSINNCLLDIPQEAVPSKPEVNSSFDSIDENNIDESAKSLKSRNSIKRPRRRCTNKIEKNIFERNIKLESKVHGEMNNVPLVNSCENSNGAIFKIDDVVWAKITGYPYWPARIISFNEEDNIFISCIEWYAWKEVSFIKVNSLFHFKEFYKSKYQRKKRSSKYQEAVKLAKSCCGMLDGVDSVISDDCRTLCSTRGSDSDSGSREGSANSAS